MCGVPGRALYIVYALLQGCAFAMAGIIHLRLHSFGNLEFITRIPMSLQAGLGDGIQAVYGPKADVLKSDINDIL